MQMLHSIVKGKNQCSHFPAMPVYNWQSLYSEVFHPFCAEQRRWLRLMRRRERLAQQLIDPGPLSHIVLYTRALCF